MYVKSSQIKGFDLFIIIGILFFFGFQSLIAQNFERSFDGQKIDIDETGSLEEVFSNFAVYQLPIQEINEFVQSSNGVKRLEFSLGNQYNWKIEIFQNNLISDDYFLQTVENGNYFEPASTNTQTFEGHFQSNLGEVRLTINPEFLFGFVKEIQETFFIEPLNNFIKDAPFDQFVIYPTSGVIPNENHKCGWNKTLDRQEELEDTPLKNAVANECYIVDLAIASDYLMWQNLGSVAAVEAHNLGVMNNVLANFRHEFADNIEYEIVTQTVSTTNPDPWITSTDASLLLADFRTWGEGGGFGVSYDLGQFWTTRDIVFMGNASTIGLAYTGGMCGSFSYHILENSGTLSAASKRVLVAHEIGHNWNAGHDASGAPFIMAPAVNNSEDWSSASISSIDTKLATGSCTSQLADCSSTSVPVPDFVTQGSSAGCVGSAISFKDFSQYGETRTWTFTGGTPSSSSAAKEDVMYPSTGSYSTTIISTNGAGSNSKTESVTLVIDNPPAAPSIPSGSPGAGGLTTVAFSNLSFSSDDAATSGTIYEDYSCDGVAELTTNNTYQMTVGIGDCGGGPLFERFALYIDYNDDGDFDDSGEEAFNSGGTGYCGTTSHSSLQFTTPSNPTLNTILRARAISDNTSISAASHTPTSGQVEDYGVVFLAPGAIMPVELSDFRATPFEDFVKLDWQTLSESNNEKFEIEKAFDGENFTRIGEIKGAGTTAVLMKYAFLDTNPQAGNNYYRLKQIDFDGMESYSETLVVNFKMERDLVIHPNPTNGELLYIDYLTQNSGYIEIQIFDVAGKALKTIQTESFEGQNNYQIEISAFANGTYFLGIVAGNTKMTKRFVKL